MTAVRLGLAVAAAASLCCASGPSGRLHAMPPPARENRGGAPPRSAAPAPPVLSRSPVAEGRGSAADAGDTGLAGALAALSRLVGETEVVMDGVDHGPGCIALARAAFARRGRPLELEVRDVADLRALAARERALSAVRRPAVGDLVFLADRPGGPAEHVGVVARTDPDGTALVLQRAARGVLRFRVNLSYPGRTNDPSTGRQINDPLLVSARPAPAGSLVVGLSELLRR